MLRQRSRPYLFSNSIPPMIAAAGIRMFDMMQESNELQDRLHENTDYFISKMKAAGFDIKPTESAICAVMLYDAKLSQQMAEGAPRQMRCRLHQDRQGTRRTEVTARPAT